MIKFLFILFFSLTALANYPPTTTKGSADSNFLTTFNFAFPNVTMSHSGTTATFGVVGPASGGTGQSSLTANNVLLGNGTSSVQFVAPGTSGNVLQSNGTTWQSTALSFSGDVHGPGSSTDSGIVLFNGASGTTLKQATGTGFVRSSSGVYQISSAISLASDVSGILPVNSGGTGASSFTANNVLLGNGTSAFQVVAPGTSGNVLQSNGTTWQSASLSVSGDVTGTSSSTSGAVVLFQGTTGKSIHQQNYSGMAFLTAGVISTAQAVSVGAGGTGSPWTPSHGGLAYSTASAISIGPVGTSGQIATSSGAGAPTWITTVPLANGGTNAAISGSTGGLAFKTASDISVGTVGTAGQLIQSNGSSGYQYLANGSTGTAAIISGTNTVTWQVPIKFAELQLDDQAGYGSTATKIPRYTNTTTNNGNGIFTFASDSTNSVTVTFLRPAQVVACISFYSNNTGDQLGVSLNGTVTTNVYSLTKANRKAYSQNIVVAGVGYATQACSAAFPVTTNDVVRPHTNGVACGDAGSCSFWLGASALPPF